MGWSAWGIAVGLATLGTSVVACSDTSVTRSTSAETAPRTVGQPLVACTPVSVLGSLPTTVDGHVLATGDVDGDGFGDLVVQQGDELVVVRGTADRQLSAPQLVRKGVTHRAAAVVDLDGDHRPEIVAATETALHVFANLGDGTFVATSQALGTTGPTNDIAAGDIDGDGRPDIVTANASCAGFSVFRTRCDGSLAPREDLYPWNIGTQVKLVDMNGDGKLDMVAGFAGWFAVLLGDGAGAFQKVAPWRTSRTSSQIAVADFDGNGTLDVAFRDTGTLSIHLNDGTGNLALGARVPDADVSLTLAAADVDGDGRAEILGVRAPDSISGTTPMATSSIAPFSVLSFAHDTLETKPAGAIITRELSGFASLADVDGDGRLDVAVTTPTGTTLVFGSEEGPRAEKVEHPADLRRFDPVHDLDGDGRPDAAWVAYDARGSYIAVALRDAQGELGQPTTLRGTASVRSIALVDMDRDGMVDILALGNAPPPSPDALDPGEGRLLVRRNLGGGTFGEPVSVWVRSAEGMTMTIVDLNGDGYPDVFVDGQVLLNDTMGALVLAADFGLLEGVTVIDADGDGDLDLVSVESVRLNDGTGRFTTVKTGVPPRSSYLAADVDGDRRVDLVVPWGIGGVQWFKGDGDGTFHVSGSLAVFNGQGNPYAVTDMNGDGVPEILATYSNGAGRGTVVWGMDRQGALKKMSVLPWSIDVVSKDETKFVLARNDDAAIAAPMTARCHAVVTTPTPRGEPEVCPGGGMPAEPTRDQFSCPPPPTLPSGGDGSDGEAIDWNRFHGGRDAGAAVPAPSEPSRKEAEPPSREEPAPATAPSAPVVTNVATGCAMGRKEGPPAGAVIVALASAIAAIHRRRARR